MRNRRVRVKGQAAYYHCISRVVAGERLLGDVEREAFRGLMGKVAAFCGVRILTFAVMSNHFHVLVEVPAPVEMLPDGELQRRYAALYGGSPSPFRPDPEVLGAILARGGSEAERWRRRLLARMHDVSAFMQTLKQRFALWFNKSRGRFGVLWAERFKSVLVEGSVRALTTVAAYIDLNPVRAGLASDPANYRWCGYAEAMAGATAARRGLAEVFRGTLGADERDWKTVAPGYRRLLFGRGDVPRDGAARIDPKRVLEVLAGGGTVPLHEALRCRVRYLSEGAAIGSSAFVAACRESAGVIRKRAVGALAGTDWGGLNLFKGLRGPRFG